MGNRLDEVYSGKEFRAFGKDLIDLIADYLENANQTAVNHWIRPETQLEYWKNCVSPASPTPLFQDILDRSIHVHHPNYIGHQISPTAPVAALAGLLSSILNNGMAVYEMGAASSAIEKIVTAKIAEKIGYDDNADGFITSGGSLANLTALLAARQSAPEIHNPNEKLAVIVSSEAHYSNEKSLRIIGIDEEAIIKVPVSSQYTMQTDQLENVYDKALSKGLKVFAVIGSAPSTSTGMHDDLQAIATFCKQKRIWFHVDGAHGGGAVFSSKYKHLLQGIERADSVTIDGHKMLLMPSIMSFLIFKERQHSYAAFKQKAVYLWDRANEEDWYDYAKRTFECTKSMMSIQFYAVLKFYGEEVFDEFVTTLYDHARAFAIKVSSKKNFELLLHPQSNIVCFRYVKDGLNMDQLNLLNSKIRSELLHGGNFYIVQTALNDMIYLRVTFMNPKTDEKIMDELLDEIQLIAN